MASVSHASYEHSRDREWYDVTGSQDNNTYMETTAKSIFIIAWE